MLKLGCTLLNLVIICLQKLTNHKFYRFFQGDRDLCMKIREGMTLRPKLLSINHIYVTRQMCAIHLLELMQGSYIHSQYVKRCLQDFTQDGVMTLKTIDQD